MRWLCALLLGVSVFVAAQQASPAPAPTSSSTANLSQSVASEGDHGLRLGTGDLVEVRVYGVPDLAQEMRVSSSGEVSLALIGRVKIGGLATEEAQALIEKRYIEGNFLKAPHVSLNIKEFATQGISVMGEVNKPGVYPAIGARRLFDLISAAGGTTKTAGRMVSITRRDKPQEPISIEFPADLAQSMASNVDVYPGDTIVVGKAGVVYVAGAVARPGGFVMESNQQLTVLQAIALAGGTAPAAKLNSARLIRKAGDAPREVPIELAKILASKSPDLPLQAEDVLFVPVSGAKSATRRGLESILQITTGLAIYGPK
jgi:polysaccharide export outer membrane protein